MSTIIGKELTLPWSIFPKPLSTRQGTTKVPVLKVVTGSRGQQVVVVAVELRGKTRGATIDADAVVPHLPPGIRIPGKRGRRRREEDAGDDAAPAPRKRLPGLCSLHGAALREQLELLCSRTSPQAIAAGERLWVKNKWPAVAWALYLCPRAEMAELLSSYVPDRALVCYYGSRSLSWVKPADCRAVAALEEEPRADCVQRAAFHAWSRSRDRRGLAEEEAALVDLAQASAERDVEVDRVRSTFVRDGKLLARGGREEPGHVVSDHERPPWEDEEEEGEEEDGPAPFGAPAQAPLCAGCRDPRPELCCRVCERWVHALCLELPALRAEFLPEARWTCAYCSEEQGAGLKQQGSGMDDDQAERFGLTPDWIISAACFDVLQLARPTPERPFIRGLLDPCSNSLLAPNIPAERLYDRAADGLSAANPWRGFHVLLNPPFSAQMQWRFVNRAIDAVENDEVPAVVLICRNSTDAGFFQRLRPYPRVLLRRKSAHFKDYEKTPIGFGIAVFMLAKESRIHLYERFLKTFERAGEPCIPIDRGILHCPEFAALLARLRLWADRHHRDHWAQCGLCERWRIVHYAALDKARSGAWTCAQLNPPFSSCATPLTRWELAGGRYASGERAEERSAGRGGGGGAAMPGASRSSAGSPAAPARKSRRISSRLEAGEEGAGPEEDEEPAAAVPRAPGTPQLDSPVAAAAGSPEESSKARVQLSASADSAPDRLIPTPSTSDSAPGALARTQSSAASAWSSVDEAHRGWSPDELAAAQGKAGEAMQRAIEQAMYIPIGGLSDDPENVLSCLELARQARIGANRAYLAALGLRASELHGPARSLGPVPTHDPALLEVARRLAARAALERAQRQKLRARREAAEARATRAAREPLLLAELEALRRREEAGAAALERVERVAEAMADGKSLFDV